MSKFNSGQTVRVIFHPVAGEPDFADVGDELVIENMFSSLDGTVYLSFASIEDDTIHQSWFEATS